MGQTQNEFSETFHVGKAKNTRSKRGSFRKIFNNFISFDNIKMKTEF